MDGRYSDARRVHPRRLGSSKGLRALGGRRKMEVATLRLVIHNMAGRNTIVHDLAKRLGITTRLYMYVNGDSLVKAPGQKLLDAAQDT